MGFSLPVRYNCAAIIVPGLFAGFIIWGIIFTTDAYVNIGTRADRFAFVAFIIAPVLLAATGAWLSCSGSGSGELDQDRGPGI